MAMRRIVRARGSFGAWALLWAIGGTVAFAGQPARWLERMNHALNTLDYAGTFAHWDGGRVQMLRIIHRLKNGVVSERLESLDGSGREFIRTGSDLTCYLPDKREVLVEHIPPKSSLIGTLPVLNKETERFYALHEGPRMRIDQHLTRLISVMPRDQYRYGYRLWIDRAGMPLKIQLWDARHGGHVIEQIAFATLKIDRQIPDSAFQPHLSTAGYRWLRNDSAPPKRQGLVWNALWLPPGFHKATQVAQSMPGALGPVEHLVYTDGLASVSVFVARHAQRAGQHPAVESAHMGASYVFSTFVDGHRVTAVGEAPALTVRAIADSVRAQPAAYSKTLPGGPFAHSAPP